MAPAMRSSGFGSVGARDSAAGINPAHKGVFRKDGEYWTTGRGAAVVRLKDVKGLAYLCHLLRHPGVEVHVLDLVGGIGGSSEEDDASSAAHALPRGDENLEKAGIHVARLGDAGELLDEQAKAEYRGRLTELREELEEAREFGRAERAEEIEEEIDALSRELSRAVGLGGRNRRAASASERARQSTTKSIKAVIDKIAQSDSRLGESLSRCIKTGTFCSYQPDPDLPIGWEFAATPIDPAPKTVSKADRVQTGDLQDMASVLGISAYSVAERTVFVGRETESKAARAVIDRALEGHGGLVMLGGGPGVGKSRFAMEMAEYASAHGFGCLIGRCYERDEPFPYLPFVEIIEGGLVQAASLDDFRRQIGDNAAEMAQLAPSLRRFFPDIPDPLELPPAQKRRHLFQSLSEVLGRGARVRPQLYILDDLHWADESTLALLTHLVDRVSQLRVVIIGIYRDQYSEENPALVRSLEEVIRLGIRPMKLNGLSKDAVAQMLNGLSQRQTPDDLITAIFEESDGNPFFVEEVYRHLLEDGKVFDAAGHFRTDIKIEDIDVPENVRLVISHRLQRLNENERRVLAAAAVIGRSFSFQLLSAITGSDVDELFTIIDKAQHMGTIIPSSEGPGTPFAFAHELVRQTLVSSTSTPRRQRLHAAAAAAIERLSVGAVNERAGDIADHLLKAGSFGDGRKLVQYLMIAGERALEAAAFGEARQSFRSALSDQNAVDPGQRADLLASFAVAERGLGRPDAAIANLREALGIYLDLGDREMIARSFADLTDALSWAAQFHEAIKVARHGLAYLQTNLSPDRVRLLAATGEALAVTAGYEPAEAALREALDLASKLPNPKLETRLLAARALFNSQFLRLTEVANDGFRSEQLIGAKAPWQRIMQLAVLMEALVYLGRLEEGVKIANTLEPLAKKFGHPYAVALCHWTKAWIEFGTVPDLAKLENTLQEASKPKHIGQSPYWEFTSELNLGMVNFHRGNWAGALSHDRACAHLNAIEGIGVGMLFRQMAYAGDRDGALAIFQENRTRLPLNGRYNTVGSWWMLALAIEGLVILGEHSQAGELYPLALELLDTGAVLLNISFRFTQTIAGIAAAAAGKWEASEEHFRVALNQTESLPYRLEQAEVRRFHAMMLLDRGARGDPEKAQTLLKAQETYMRIGMPRHLEMMRNLLETARFPQKDST